MADELEETRALQVADLVLAPGTLLARRYRLSGQLGRGMGVVFRATDEQLDREVAVKVLPAAAPSSEARERLLREARAAAALNHSGIVAVHDVGEHERKCLPSSWSWSPAPTSMEPPDLHEIVRVAVAICDALEHAHAHGVVHRDLKPENILLSGVSEPRGVKLADLGRGRAHARGPIAHTPSQPRE